MQKKYALCIVIALATLVFFPGCKGPLKSPGSVPVAGVVLLDGQPVEGANLTFYPMSPEGRAASGRSGPEGKFTVGVLQTDEGVPPGDYAVSVSKKIDTTPLTDDEKNSLSNRGLSYEVTVEYVVPIEYENPNMSGITVTVPPKGDKNIRIELTTGR